MRPLPALFDTVTPALIVTFAPVFMRSGVVLPPSQFALITMVDVTVTPPLQAARARPAGHAVHKTNAADAVQRPARALKLW
ncbi:MAG: hypothetical protein JNK71_03775 [Methyloversatilis sp.]|uniref:hypothetical protein n=1 Tax=Methyloversatilis sp. TaxID=2569862 RepID=UPI001A4D7AA5|nr:hypothetical protein [Methyloversatilis sp.]MBL8475174.1 hypothetical protein [Methyloversatilis sp.]